MRCAPPPRRSRRRRGRARMPGTAVASARPARPAGAARSASRPPTGRATAVGTLARAVTRGPPGATWPHDQSIRDDPEAARAVSGTALASSVSARRIVQGIVDTALRRAAFGAPVGLDDGAFIEVARRLAERTLALSAGE